MLLPPEGQRLLAKYVTTCWNCGLPAPGTREDVCPVCGSTSWGWVHHGAAPLAASLVAGLLAGEIVGAVLTSFLTGPQRSAAACFFGLLSLAGPVHGVGSRAGKGEGGGGPLDWWWATGLLLVMGLVLSSVRWHLGPYGLCGMVWGLWGYDSWLFARRRGVPINGLLRSMADKQARLEGDLERVQVEQGRLEAGRRSAVTQELIARLVEGRKLIGQEISQLAADRSYTEHLRLFLVWRNCLFTIYTGLSRFAPDDLDGIDEMNRRLRLEILEVREFLKGNPSPGRMGVVELRDYIEQTLSLHESVRDLVQAQRTNHVLAGVDLLQRYELPRTAIPLLISDFEATTDEILDQVNVHFFRMQADTAANGLVRS